MEPRRFIPRAVALVALALTLANVLGCSLAVKAPAATLSPAPTRTLRGNNDLNVIQATSSSPGQQALSVTEVADRVSPAVVQVTNQQEVSTQQFQRPVPEVAGIGSGVIYDPSGLILTNDHVVAGADRLLVALPDGRTFDARIVGTDPRTDLAVIRVDGQNLPVATLGSAGDLEVGQPVVAIGNALGLTGGPTVTQGIVSALDRAVQQPSIEPEGTPEGERRGGAFLFDLIQTDAAINPGNSGGPLVDLQARVIGINTIIAATTAAGEPVEGIGFAISVDTARRIATQLVTTGRAVHPFLGVEYIPLNPGLAARLNAPVDRGMYVTDVVPNSPAAQAGLREGDIIVNADGQELEAESSLARVIDGKQPGDSLDITILRDGRRRTIRVTLVEEPPA